MSGYFELDGFDRRSEELQVNYPLPGLTMVEARKIIGTDESEDFCNVVNIPAETVKILSEKYGFKDESDIYDYELSYYEP